MITLYYIFFAITFIYSLYFVITGLFILKKNKTKIKNSKELTKFAVLIPARNEENVIKDLITSLKSQTYKSDLYDIYVLINNCTDNTRNIVEKEKVNIIDVKKKTKTKGEVLKYAFNELKDTNYDAYLIFDADNVVDKKFLSIMNNVYQSGYIAAQGRKDSKNVSDSWISTSYTLFYYMQNVFYNASRTHVKMSSTINGTGFMIAKSFIDKGFNPKTITEDIEISIMCILDKKQIVYVDKAITYDEQPTDFKTSWHQRIRWSKGIMQCTKHYGKKLLTQFFREGNASALDKFIFIIAPFIQLLSFALTIELFIFNKIGIELNDVFSYIFNSGMLCFLIFYIIGVILNILILKLYDRTFKDNILGVLTFTVFILSWIPINIACLFKKDVKWKEIKHDKKLEKAN